MADKSYLKKLTSGVFKALTDLILWNMYLVGSSFGKNGSRGVYQAFAEADEMLKNYNHNTIISAIQKLKKGKLVTLQKRNNLYSPKITAFGQKRLMKILPLYNEERPWDSKIYLITYDISENAHSKRSRLRKFLKDLSCKKLQESVWLTPYNIRELLNKFVKKNGIPGTIIISDIGKDGGIGETTLAYLINQLYNLENLNKRYNIFINNVKRKNNIPKNLIFEYLSILRDDPQLPFQLLDKKFLGEKAYSLYLTLRKNICNR